MYKITYLAVSLFIPLHVDGSAGLKAGLSLMQTYDISEKDPNATLNDVYLPKGAIFPAPLCHQSKTPWSLTSRFRDFPQRFALSLVYFAYFKTSSNFAFQ